MRKLIVLLLIFSLCLAACGAKTETVAHTFEDLTIQIPADYVNLSEEDYADGLDFVFGLDPIAINGQREEKATFEAYGLEIDLERYGSLLLKSNNINGKMEEKDGVLSYTYISGDITYVVTLWETEEAFWAVQGYCPTENYAKAKNDMWAIFKSITV